jgi:hypothetical protein
MSEQTDRIVNSFPGLFHRDDGKMFTNIGIGDGWLRLVYDLCAAIQIEAERAGVIPEIIQIKEKFGMLRFYVHGTNPAMRDLIAEAEARSKFVCESCGLLGELRNDGWLHVACDPCEKKRGSR